MDAMFFHMKKLEDESRRVARQLMADMQEKNRRETSKIGRLLSLYVDDSVPELTTFGEVRRRAWKIMSRETLKSTAQRMSVKPASRLVLQWQAVDGMTVLIRRRLRPLYLSLDLTSMVRDSPWLRRLTGSEWCSAKSRLFCSSHLRNARRKPYRRGGTRICWDALKMVNPQA